MTRTKVKKKHLHEENALERIKFMANAFKKELCRAIQNVLAGQKWPAGPALAAPDLNGDDTKREREREREREIFVPPSFLF